MIINILYRALLIACIVFRLNSSTENSMRIQLVGIEKDISHHRAKLIVSDTVTDKRFEIDCPYIADFEFDTDELNAKFKNGWCNEIPDSLPGYRYENYSSVEGPYLEDAFLEVPSQVIIPSPFRTNSLLSRLVMNFISKPENLSTNHIMVPYIISNESGTGYISECGVSDTYAEGNKSIKMPEDLYTLIKSVTSRQENHVGGVNCDRNNEVTALSPQNRAPASDIVTVERADEVVDNEVSEGFKEALNNYFAMYVSDIINYYKETHPEVVQDDSVLVLAPVLTPCDDSGGYRIKSIERPLGVYEMTRKDYENLGKLRGSEPVPVVLLDDKGSFEITDASEICCKGDYIFSRG